MQPRTAHEVFLTATWESKPSQFGLEAHQKLKAASTAVQARAEPETQPRPFVSFFPFSERTN